MGDIHCATCTCGQKRHGHDLLSPFILEFADTMCPDGDGVRVIHEALEKQGLQCWCVDNHLRSIGRP